MPTSATRTVPTITDPNLLLVEFTGPADDLGQRPFFAYWLAGNVGPRLDQVGTRGQAFNTCPDAFVKRTEARGKRVQFLNS